MGMTPQKSGERVVGASQCKLAIVICTFRRPDMLARLLRTLFQQKCPGTIELSVFVVDNSDERSASAVMSEAVGRSPFPLKILTAHPANIAHARNVGVAAALAADAEAVAFLDDDQEVAAGWFEAAGLALENGRRDAWLGCVHPRFEGAGHIDGAAVRMFSRDFGIPQPRGTELFAYGPNRTREFPLGAGNSIFRRAALVALGDAPFDPRFGASGGEDTDAFFRLQRGGFSMGWLPEARVHEHVPTARVSKEYLRRRSFVGGQIFRSISVSQSARPARAALVVRTRAFAQAALLMVAAPAALFTGRWEAWCCRLAASFGKLSFGAPMPLYAKPAPKGAGS